MSWTFHLRLDVGMVLVKPLESNYQIISEVYITYFGKYKKS